MYYYWKMSIGLVDFVMVVHYFYFVLLNTGKFKFETHFVYYLYFRQSNLINYDFIKCTAYYFTKFV